MSDVLNRVNEGYYEKQFTNFRSHAPYLTQIGIELLTLVRQQQEEIERLKQANNTFVNIIKADTESNTKPKFTLSHRSDG